MTPTYPLTDTHTHNPILIFFVTYFLPLKCNVSMSGSETEIAAMSCIQWKGAGRMLLCM